MKTRTFLALAALVAGAACTSTAAPSSLTGELRLWHKLTLDFTGPETSERAEPNPFLNYRLNVTFTHTESGRAFVVPGYFAADGKAAETSAESGSVWRAHFAPDATGGWTWSAQFRTGRFVAVSSQLLAGESGGFMDGAQGSFTIAASDKTGSDFRARGRLEYIGTPYPRFAGNREYFLKQGPDSPENLLSYADFDGTFHTDGHKDELVKTWAAHVRDSRDTDPTWKGGKGKGLLGALNYIADKGMNSISMVTMNIKGDDQNVFPFLTYDIHDRYDVSKLDQWERVFEHAQKRGLMLHFKLTEMESQGLLDHGAVGLKQMAYYREMLARFGHHLALTWNLGEENGEWIPNHPTTPMNTAQRHAMAAWFHQNNSYHHLLVIHNGLPFDDMLGAQVGLSGIALQGGNGESNAVVQHWRALSRATGHRWIISHDEQGPANSALPPDDIEPDHISSRQGSLWGGLLGGTWGSEWYFGYKNPHSDLSCVDWRTRDKFWDQARHALDFFKDNRIPFWEMNPLNELISHRDGYCLALPGDTYVVFLKTGGTRTVLNLGSAGGLYTGLGKERLLGTYDIRWFDPRNGGALRNGSITTIMNTGDTADPADGTDHTSRQYLGLPPSDPDRDWVVLVRKQKTP
jgi:hypothetical protein